MSIHKVSLASVADVFNGKTPSKAEKRNSGHPVLKIKDVDEKGDFRGHFQSFVDEEFLKKYKKKQIYVGDSLILNAAHNADYVGSKQFWAGKEVEGAIATGEWLIVRPYPKDLDPSFARHWLQSPETHFKIKKLVKGIHIYPKDVEQLNINLPPLNKQKHIAAILDKADGIRRKRQKAIKLADQFLSSVFLDMFGDPVINPKGWEMVELKNLLGKPLQNGLYVPKGRYTTHSDDQGVEMVHMSDAFYGIVQRGGLKRTLLSKAEINQYNLTENDILVARRSLTYEGAAKPCLIPKSDCPLVFESSLIRVTPDKTKLLPSYLYTYMSEPRAKHKYILKYISQSTISGINQNGLMNIVVTKPPIAMQKKFEDIFIRKSILSGKMQILKEQGIDLFNSLTQRAFRGEL